MPDLSMRDGAASAHPVQAHVLYGLPVARGRERDAVSDVQGALLSDAIGEQEAAGVDSV